jgi:hypothetical protein
MLLETELQAGDAGNRQKPITPETGVQNLYGAKTSSLS